VLTDWFGEKPSGASSQTQDLVGHGVISKIYAREPIQDSRLALKGVAPQVGLEPTTLRLTALVPDEKRSRDWF
jgi:hypothetical protein